MQAFAIVEADVVGDVGYRLVQVFEFLEVHHLSTETAKKGFHVGVVPTVALAAHADPQLGLIEGGTVFPVGILRPLVGGSGPLGRYPQSFRRAFPVSSDIT